MSKSMEFRPDSADCPAGFRDVPSEGSSAGPPAWGQACVMDRERSSYSDHLGTLYPALWFTSLPDDAMAWAGISAFGSHARNHFTRIGGNVTPAQHGQAAWMFLVYSVAFSITYP